MRISTLQNLSALTAAASYSGGSTDNNTASEATIQADSQSQGDKVTLSPEGIEKSKNSGDDSASPAEAKQKLIREIKEKIERVKAEIEELENSDIPPEQKEQMLKLKQQELAMYQAELVAAMKEAVGQFGVKMKTMVYQQMP